ncbi:MAG: MarR family transcriptional regulator [Firmicutes bacterium]|nr:MarR family transcriptional regulator [Alicyclobacillaceae bacterium]MCL6497605.1 MarR family transcriptional regulator [Bacillota bacterium]
MAAPDQSLPNTDTQRAVRAVLDLVALLEPLLLNFWRAQELTLKQVRCLTRLRRQPALAGDLAQSLGLSAASMTRMLERLESRGWVTRTIDPADRRRITVALTPAGAELVAGWEFWWNSPLVQAVRAMDSSERLELARVVEGLVAKMRALAPGTEERQPSWDGPS